MFDMAGGLWTNMEVWTLVMGLLGLFAMIGATAWVIWSGRNQKNTERVWGRLDLLVTKDDMREYVNMSQRPLSVKLDAITTELRGIRERV